MTIWELLGAMAVSYGGFLLLLDWDWKRKLLRHHGEKNP